MKPKVILKKWRGRIARAKRRGYFTDFDHELALDWSRCAVGERDCLCEKVIPKYPLVFELMPHWRADIRRNEKRGEIVGERMYAKVANLGRNFHQFITQDKFDKALLTLKKIEALPKGKFYRK